MTFSEFQGKTVIVTGAGGGIGRAIVKKLVDAGADVIGVSLIQDELNDLVKEFPSVKPIQADVTDWDGIREALKDVGPIHGLVNNAGICRAAPFLGITKQDYDLTFDVNVKAIINVSQVVAKNMLENNVVGGSIVNMSSICAITALPNTTVYCASKAAVQSITRSMGLELGKHGIRVNSVNPTIVKTDLSKGIWASDPISQKFLAMTPLGRYAEREEVADAVTFLLSEKASMVNGIPLPVDGGFLI